MLLHSSSVNISKPQTGNVNFTVCASRASGNPFEEDVRVGERRHPCLAPIVVLNHSPVLPFL